MDLLAILKFSTEKESGVSASGKPYRRCTAVLETVDKFPKQVAVTCLDAMCDRIKTFGNGSLLKFGLDADSHKYQGKYYTELRAWSIRPAYEPKQPAPEVPDFDKPLEQI